MAEWTLELRRDPTPSAYEQREVGRVAELPSALLRACTGHNPPHVDGYYLSEIHLTAKRAVYEFALTGPDAEFVSVNMPEAVAGKQQWGMVRLNL